MTSVAHVTAMYATKRRRRNSVRTVRSKDSQQSKSNPSKRHRERLNQELDTLASLLPFEQSVLSKLDKLSILRLSVSYLRTKSYFQAALASSRLLGGQQVPRAQPHLYQNQFGTGSQQLEPPASAAAIQQQQQQHYPAELRVEGDLIVQALNGFLLILTCDGEVFYTSHTVETYLGFHQSDICHQSVYELVHSEDRAELMQQLKWSSMISQQAHTTNGSSSSAGAGSATSGSVNTLLEGERGQVGVGSGEPKSASQMSLQEILASAEHRHLLERNFTVRFRCLLDNTSGFLRLDIRGRIKVLHGQQNQHNLANSANKKQQQQFEANEREPMLAFFGVCIPFGPPSLLEMPSKDSVFKSKHRLDMSLISMDSRGRQLLGLSDLSSVVSKQTGAASASAGESTISVGPDSPAPAHSSKLTGGSHIKQELSGASKAAFKQNSVSAYDLVHHDDLSYMASAHQELLKTGASGLIAYRMVTQTDGKYQWLQTSAKLYYKNSKPDFILCTHRPLMDEEGRDLLGKRTMDFKVTYLDVGLSSINDRIMACDKFSSLQALGNSSLSGGHTRSKSPSATTASAVAVAVTGTQQATTNGAHLISSPSLSGGSSRSLNSLSPQSMLNDDNQVSGQRSAAAASKAASKRKSTYDLNSNHQNHHHQHHHNHHLQQQQHQYMADDYETHGSQDRQHSFNPSTNTTYDQYHYKRSQNGDIFYDMDATVSLVGNHDESANRKSSSANKKKTTKNAKLSAKKQRDNLTQLDTNHLGEPLVLLDNGKATKKSQQLSSDTSSQVASAHQQVSMVDQQLHLYSHYNQQQHQHHLQTAADTDASSYPAIQAAAVYAASLGHQHPASAVAANQAAAYGSSQMQQLGYSHHNHTSQSLYGSSAAAAMVSPSSAYTQHQHHHSHLHHLDSAAGYQSSAAASHYGAFASHHQVATGGYSTGSSATAAAAVAASGSFLPAEHLLHHYSQSARSAALAASWPTTSATAPQSSSTSSVTTDYHQHAHHSHQSAYGGSSAAAWNSSAAAAAAAALVASANTGTGNDLKQRDLGAYSPSGATQVHQDHYSHLSEQQQQYQHHMHAQHQQQQQQQQQRHTSSPSGATDSSSPSNKSSSLSAVAASVAVQRYTNLTSAHGPASLNSDGSAHRSPISSSESSNGSGSLAAARAAAACSGIAATSDSVASNISPNTYYLAEQHSSQQLQQQQQHQQQQQQQQSYAHHNQQLAAYHQNPYAAAAAAHQYADSTSAAHFNSHHHYHSHHQQISSSDQQVTGYFPSNTSADLTASTGGNPGHGSAASTMAATVKLYGANGESNHHLEHYPPPASTFDNKFGEWTRDYEGRLLSSDVASTPGQLQDLDHPYQTFAPVKRQETTFSSWAGETVESLSQSASSEAAFSTTAEEPTSGEVQEEDSAEAEIGGQFKDPLARLISYTIGDIMLDIAPQPTVTAATATTTTTTTTTTTSTTITTTDEQAK